MAIHPSDNVVILCGYILQELPAATSPEASLVVEAVAWDTTVQWEAVAAAATTTSKVPFRFRYALRYTNQGVGF